MSMSGVMDLSGSCFGSVPVYSRKRPNSSQEVFRMGRGDGDRFTEILDGVSCALLAAVAGPGAEELILLGSMVFA